MNHTSFKYPEQQKRLFPSPSKETLSKPAQSHAHATNQGIIKEIEEDSDLDINDKVNKMFNATEHCIEIKNLINVRTNIKGISKSPVKFSIFWTINATNTSPISTHSWMK